MGKFQTRKVKTLLKHFKQAQIKGIEKPNPQTKPSTPQSSENKLEPKINEDLLQKIKDLRVEPAFPKIIIESADKQVINQLNKRIKETSEEVEKGDRRFYELYSELNTLKEQMLGNQEKILPEQERIKEHKEIFNLDKESNNEFSEYERKYYELYSELQDLKNKVSEQDEELDHTTQELKQDFENDFQELQNKIDNLNSKEPQIITKHYITRVEEKPKPIETKKYNSGLDKDFSKPIIAKDKRVDEIQDSLVVMQHKLNQLINIKNKEQYVKMKENQEKLKELGRIIKKFEIKLIRLQGKYKPNKLKPLVEKINALKDKYNEMVLKTKSDVSEELRPVKLENFADRPFMEVPGTKVQIHKEQVPEKLQMNSGLELPDINEPGKEMNFDIPDPIPDVPDSFYQKQHQETKKKKKGFIQYLEDEVKKFIGV